MAKFWYYQHGYSGEPKRPNWTASKSRPNKRRQETHDFTLAGKTAAQVASEVEKFKQSHDIKSEPKFQSYYGNVWLRAQYLETQESLEKRQAEWDTERETYNAAMEKYKPLKKKWDKEWEEKQRALYAKQQNTQDNFVVVKLTPAQYKKLISST
jgi:hypothetical protein